MSAAVGSSNEGSSEMSRGPSRKRRRRAVTTGASDDCFACRKRKTQCDRVRPFCGQCLEMGQECSGYKTTLTWNVGVASRGKLRGMALPVIADSEAKAPRAVEAQADKVAASSSGNAVIQRSVSPQEHATANKRKRTPAQNADAGKTSTPAQSSKTSKTWPRQGVRQEPPSNSNHKFSFKMEYDNAEKASVASTSSHTSGSVNTLSPASIATPLVDAGHTGQYVHAPDPNANFPDPFEQQQYRSNVAGSFGQIALVPHQKFPSRQIPPTPGSSEPDRFFAGLAHSIPSPADSHSTYSLFDDEAAYATSLIPARTYDGWMLDSHATHAEDDDDWRLSVVNSHPSQIPQALLDMPFYQQSPRMRYLLDFYDKAICPVLVTFDGPINPYRDHIMRLAMQSSGLQHAIAALVTNNLRMRHCEYIPWQKQKRERRALLTAPGHPTDEEQFHKSKSIKLLNEQLQSGNCSDDSVLATLLVLCLFHVCNSGLTKFRTQLAGVQKLLRMRSKDARSDFIGWVEMFFAWFDVMTSAVNNRETEIRGDSLDMTDFTANLGALEHYSGCDGRLFKLIARLGRLNLLSQSRPVREATMQGPLGAATEHAQFWSDKTQPTPVDMRDSFWREWHDVRERLYRWKFGDDGGTPVDDKTGMSVPQQHIVDISEAFRWSALLYTERLAYPQLPSKSENFQRLVERSMAHIDDIGVNSCVTKFLLWPLFVTGTECVEERDRDMIRQRCVEIQKESGFYNNISGLQVLERMWHESDVNGQRLQAPRGQAFWWRTAMDRVDGEYVVI